MDFYHEKDVWLFGGVFASNRATKTVTTLNSRSFADPLSDG